MIEYDMDSIKTEAVLFSDMSGRIQSLCAEFAGVHGKVDAMLYPTFLL